MRMPRKPVRKLEFCFGVILLLCVYFTLFVIPVEALTSPGKRNSGYILLGISALMGEYGVRYFGALPFAVLAWYCFRAAWKPLDPASGSATERE